MSSFSRQFTFTFQSAAEITNAKARLSMGTVCLENHIIIITHLTNILPLPPFPPPAPSSPHMHI